MRRNIIKSDLFLIEVAIESPEWKKLNLDPIRYVKDVVATALAVCMGYESILSDLRDNKLFPAIIEYAEEKERGPSIELAILLSNDERLHKLNLQFLVKDSPTNVLSFLNEEISSIGGAENIRMMGGRNSPLYIGDMAISYQRIYEESVEQKKDFYAYFAHIIVHGVLHLLGFDHMKDKEAGIMMSLEDQILESFEGRRV